MAKGNIIGSWAFLIGVILAVVLGAWKEQLSTTFVYILVVIGLVVGILNITGRETNAFLMSGTVLVIISGFGGGAVYGVKFLPGILAALMTIFVPATIVVAIKNVFTLARN